ncbi:gamma-glutamyl-gamma-aminobutyrate hydrolase family protein [Companilactobacillus jidongensis]|uniref:gamma-glutamyl-gamma-aminobutyrate hydrolase family protein n=1 Tax=Companilactobacillus jidongensis TaxID=2486006 RepID=UPI000F7B4ADE|nr:gamma-glutamyl-gamma-aminobutyrate hydrolase family protein [Companilactobacillus jidongensis]
MSKIIGITADVFLEPASAINKNKADFVPRPAVNAVLQAGGVPVSLPYYDSNSLDKLDDLLSALDGIIFTGGPDVDPTFMGEEPIPELGTTNRYRDVSEISLVKKAVARHIPIFGICRGAQVINVALGGSVYQDLATQYDEPTLLMHHQKAAGNIPIHHVEVSKSILQESVGHEVFVNSRHHQAIKEPAPNIKVVATAPDGVIEGIENEDATIQAVQWHPENMWEEYPEELQLFKDFIGRI